MSTKRSGVDSPYPRRRELFHVSVSETAIHFQREGRTWKSSPEMVYYSMEDETPFQHPEWVSVMSKTPRVRRENVLC